MTDQPSPESIFERVLQCTGADERTICLGEACGGNEELRREVESLLAAHHAAGSFLEPQVAPEAATPGEQEGDRIGHYKLLELIGEGGFGRVWMAEQTEPVKRRVALKVIKPGMDSQEVIARFEAERQALALMDHPHIAHVHEAGATESGRPYFVMELVKGIPLTRYCNERNLGTNQRLELFLDVCSAVQHAHQKGIIHRDLKPSNILASPHDGEPIAKVIDFGIAKAIGMELTDKTLFTALGRLIGTPQYMSPEQAELNALDVDTRSDIYSLGVILYELLTGSTPLDGERLRSAGYEEMQRMIREETPKKPSTRISELREHSQSLTRDRESELRALQNATARELDWIVLKALEKERQRRYQTADSFADDLRRYLADEAVEARPPSAIYRLRKVARRHRGKIAAAATITITLIAGAVTSTWLAVTATRAKQEAEREAAISKAVNDFINEDLFPAASPDQEPDRDLKVRTVLDRASASIEGRFEDQPLVEASIRYTLAQVYRSLGEYTASEKHARRSYELHQRDLGDENGNTLQSLTMLGTAHCRQGGLDQAIRILRQVHETSNRKFGPKHPITLAAMSNLANACDQAGLTDEALKLRQHVLKLRREVSGPEHPETIIAMQQMAISFYNVRRWDEALSMKEKVLEISKKVKGPEHPETLRAMHNLAISLYHAERIDEALAMWEEALPLLRKRYGEDHPTTALVTGTLAKTYLSRAEELLFQKLDEKARAEAKKCRNLGPDALPGEARSRLSVLERTLLERANPAAQAAPDPAAKQLVEAARQGDVQRIGQLLDSGVKADAMNENGSRALMEAAVKGHVEVIRKLLQAGADPNQQDQNRDLAEFGKARRELERAKEICRQQQLTGKDQKWLAVRHAEGRLLFSEGHPDQAQEIYEEILPTMQDVLGPGHPYTLETARLLESIRRGEDGLNDKRGSREKPNQ